MAATSSHLFMAKQQIEAEAEKRGLIFITGVLGPAASLVLSACPDKMLPPKIHLVIIADRFCLSLLQ